MLSAIALYSSGPVTPSMRNRPCASWWPSERHSRAVSTSSSSPTSRSNSSSSGRRVVARDGVGDVGVDVERGRARRPVGRSTPGRGSSATGTPRPASPSCSARSRARSSVACRQRSASRRRLRHRVGEHRQHEALACPRTCARRSRARSGPWRRSPAPRRARRPAARGRARSAPPAAARRRPRSRRRRAPRSRRGRRAAPRRRPSQPVCRASASAATTWSRTRRRASAGSTSRRR